MEPSNYREHPPPANVWTLTDGQPTSHSDNASALAQAIVDTSRNPLLVLDQDLRIVSVNRSFCQMFGMDGHNVRGLPIYGLGDGQWDIPELRLLLKDVAPRHTVMEAYEVERDFPIIGRRTMLLDARELYKQKNAQRLILLAIEDITDRRAAERQLTELLQQKEMLLQEIQHRVANSLQIIASILLLKAQTIQSEETRLHLHDAYRRVMSVATVQQQLQGSGHGELIDIGLYLSKLCDTLLTSMIGDSRPILLKVAASASTVVSGEAASIGLITTELVINALKHGFPGNSGGEILVKYEVDEANWCLSVSDDGVGLQPDGGGRGSTGLGTSIVEALANQLKARVELTSRSPGISVSIVHTA